jgi:hypothetical protein
VLDMEWKVVRSHTGPRCHEIGSSTTPSGEHEWKWRA